MEMFQGFIIGETQGKTLSGFFTICKESPCYDGQRKVIQPACVLNIYSNTGAYDFFGPKACNLLVKQLTAGVSGPSGNWI